MIDISRNGLGIVGCMADIQQLLNSDNRNSCFLIWKANIPSEVVWFTALDEDTVMAPFNEGVTFAYIVDSFNKLRIESSSGKSLYVHVVISVDELSAAVFCPNSEAPYLPDENTTLLYKVAKDKAFSYGYNAYCDLMGLHANSYPIETPSRHIWCLGYDRAKQERA